MLCVLAMLSAEAEKKLEQLREKALPGVKFSPLHAHITLATWLPEDAGAFMDACEKMFRNVSSFTVCYERIEVLSETSIIVAMPSMSDELVSIHNRIAKEYGSFLDQWTSVRWYPHSTLLYNPSMDLEAVCAEMRKHFVPFDARIEAIEFSRVDEKGYTILNRISLL